MIGDSLQNLYDPRSRNREIAFGAEGTVTVSKLLADAQVVSGVLPEKTEGSHVLLVFRKDRYLFAVSMLAAWLRGHSVALPPNTRRGAILSLKERDDTAAVLHDTDSGLEHRVQTILEDSKPSIPGGDAVELRGLTTLPEPLATVFTSGTTGDMAACPKSSRQLLGEAVMLRDNFFAGEDQRIVSTVPPGHIYGLLYSVLVPLLSNHSFLRETPLLPETVASKIDTYSADVLVTVPAHLRTLVSADGKRFHSLTRVLSSTAPLADSTATAFAKHTRKEVTEVLGSSETGGIAWRARPAGNAFHPLPGVRVDVDNEGRLLVDSPYIDERIEPPYRAADLAELCEDGTFRHIGRVDGVIKVGGRRVSLPAMQRWLTSTSGVLDAAVTSVETPGGRGRSILAAVVAESSLSRKVLLDAMSEHYERSSLPRRLIFVDELPREDNGKIQRARLLSLFDLDAKGAPMQWDLDWAEPRTKSDSEGNTLFSCSILVPERYAWFDGHFEGYPVMAAAVQLKQIVEPALKLALGGSFTAVRRITRMKFTGRIQPGDAIDIELSWGTDPTASRFSIMKGETVCSSGNISLEEPS